MFVGTVKFLSSVVELLFTAFERLLQLGPMAKCQLPHGGLPYKNSCDIPVGKIKYSTFNYNFMVFSPKRV